MPDLVIKNHCNRCPAVEERAVTPQQAAVLAQDTDADPILNIEYEGEVILRYDYLCANCRQIVVNYLGNIGKELKHKSGVRKRKNGSDDSETVAEDVIQS